MQNMTLYRAHTVHQGQFQDFHYMYLFNSFQKGNNVSLLTAPTERKFQGLLVFSNLKENISLTGKKGPHLKKS